MSLVASTGGVTLLPLYAQNLLSPSVVIRPLQGEAPTIDLVIGYSKANTSPLLKRFLSRADELVARVTKTSMKQTSALLLLLAAIAAAAVSTSRISGASAGLSGGNPAHITITPFARSW